MWAVIIILLSLLGSCSGVCDGATLTSQIHAVNGDSDGDYSAVVVIDNGVHSTDSYVYSNDPNCKLDVFGCEIVSHNFITVAPTCTPTKNGDTVSYTVGSFSQGFQATVRLTATFSGRSGQPAFIHDTTYAYPCTALSFSTTAASARVYVNEGLALDPATLGVLANHDHEICGVASYDYHTEELGGKPITVGPGVYPTNKIVTVTNEASVVLTISALSKQAIQSSNSLSLTVQGVARVGTLGTLPVEPTTLGGTSFGVYKLAKDEARVIDFGDFQLGEVGGVSITDYFEITQYSAQPYGPTKYPNYLEQLDYNNSLHLSLQTRGPCTLLSDCSSLKLVGDTIAHQYTKIYASLKDKIDSATANQYVTDYTFVVWDWETNNQFKDNSKDWTGTTRIYAGTSTSGCTQNTNICAIVKYQAELYDTTADFCSASLISGSAYNDDLGENNQGQILVDTVSALRTFSYRFHSQLYQSNTISKTYYYDFDVAFEIVCGGETLTAKDGATSFKLITGPVLAKSAQIYSPFDGWTSSVALCPFKYFFLCDTCTDTTSTTDRVVQIEPYTQSNLKLNSEARVEYVFDGTFFRKELNLLAATAAHETNIEKQLKVPFTYTMCGVETLKPTTEASEDYLVLNPSSTPITVAFSAVIATWFTVDLGTQSHDDCILRSTVTLLAGDCTATPDLDPTVTLNLDSAGSVASISQDISNPRARSSYCIEVKTLGLKVASKKFIYEICGQPILTGPSDLEFTPIAIDGSEIKYIFQSQWEALFDNPSQNCSIVKYDFLEASSQVEEGVLVFDYTDASNFQANTHAIFALDEGTQIVDQIELLMLQTSLLKMQKNEELKLQRFIRATTISGFIFVQPLLFTFVKTVDFAPYYTSFPYDSIRITVYQANQIKFKFKSYAYKLPEALDHEGGDIEVALSQERPVPWIELVEDEDKQYEVQIKDNLISARDHGANIFRINLNNPNESPRSYKMTVEIDYKEVDLEKELGIGEGEDKDSKGQDDARRAANDGPALQLAIEQIDVSHAFILSFNSPVEIDSTKSLGSAIKFTSISGEDGTTAIGSYSGSEASRRRLQTEPTKSKEFSWFISSKQETRFTIQIEFQDKLEVSASSFDEIHMDIQDPSIFHSLTGLPLEMTGVQGSCSVPGVLFCQKVPPFLSLETKQQLQATATLYEGSLKSLTAGNVFIVIFFGGTLQHLWGVIRPLQHLSTLGLIGIIFPGNLFQFFSEMVDIANMDVLFGQQINEYLFTFVDMKPFNDFFDTFGIETNNLMLNTGSIIIPLVPLLILQYLLYSAFKRIGQKYFRSRTIRKFDRKTEGLKINIRPALLTLFAEGFIELSLSCFLNIYSLFFISSWAQAWNRFQIFGEGLQMTLTLVALLLIVGIPSYLSYALFSKGKWEQFEFSEPVSEVFFSRVKMKRATTAFYEVSIMFLKMTTCFLLVAKSDLPLLQLFAIFVIQFAHLGYLYWVDPFQDWLVNLIEKFDQSTIFLVLYPFILMTNTSINIELKERCGWFVILSISLNIFINLSVSIYLLFQDFRLDRIKNRAKEAKAEQLKYHIINRKRIISQFPGQFPEFEAFVEFHLEKARFEEWVKERTFLLERGINISSLPEEIEYQKMIRRFNLPRAKAFEAKKKKYRTRQEQKKSNEAKKLKRDRVYNRLKEYQFRNEASAQVEEELWTIKPTSPSRLKEDILLTMRSTARMPLEVIDEVESEAEVVNPFEFNASVALASDLERLKSLGLAISESKASDGKAIILGSIAAELNGGKEVEAEVDDFIEVKAASKLKVINPQPFRSEEESFIEKNNFLRSNGREDKTRDLFTTAIPMGLFVKNLGKSAGMTRGGVAIRATVALIAGMAPLLEVRSYYAKGTWFPKAKKPSPWQQSLLDLWRDLGSVPPSLLLSSTSETAVNITKPLENLGKVLLSKKIKHLHPIAVLDIIRKETGSEVDFLRNNTLKYSKAEPYEFLIQINKLDISLIQYQVQQAVMAYHLEPVGFLSRCLGRLQRTLISCSLCEKLLSAEFQVSYKITIRPGSGTVEDGIADFFASEETTSDEFACFACRQKKVTIARKVASPPYYLIVDASLFDKAGQRRIPRKDLEFRDMFLKLPSDCLPEWEETRELVADLIEESKQKDHYSLEEAEETIISTILRSSGDYELVSVICHKGRSTSDGQYFTFSKDPGSEVWYEQIESWCSPVADITAALRDEKSNVVCAIYRLLAPFNQQERVVQSRKTKIYS